MDAQQSTDLVALHAKPRHKRAARAIFNGLVTDEPETWDTVPVLLSIFLKRHERASIAYQALRSLDEQDRLATIAAVYCQKGGDA